MKLLHPVYYCFTNNILKHEGSILHICDAKLLMRDVSPRAPVGL